MSEKRRAATGWLGSHGLLFAMVLLATLSALSGCGSGQTDTAQTGNSVPVDLNISMPQESAAASTRGSRFWATVYSWLPSLSNAWAVTYDLSELTVTVTDSDQQLLTTSTKHFSQPPESGDRITFDLDVPAGSDRIFAVSGIDRRSRRPILQGKRNHVTLIAGKAATVDITLAGVGQPTISDPASLPIGVVRMPYSARLTATGGTPPYTWSVAPPLPDGLTFTPAGSTATIGGTPQEGTARTTDHTFSVTDSSSPAPKTGTRIYSLTIAPPGLAIITRSLPNGTVTQRYSTTVAASGGTPPYTWSIVGDLPPAPGLFLSPSGATAGLISGTPNTNVGSPFTRTYQVQDSAIPQRTATKSLSIVVNLPSPPNITTQTLPNGAFRQSYNQTLQVLGGTPPFVWSFTGALPTGLRLDRSTGVIAGTAGEFGTFSFTPQVVDSTGQTDPTPPPLSITITKPIPPTITTPSPLPTGTVNQLYPATTLTAKDGAPPLTWDPVVTPPLPNGLRFDPNTATISGVPLNASKPTTHTFTVQDSTAPSNQTGTKGLLLTINSALTIDTTTLPTGTVTQDYSATLSATGGTPPYTWSIDCPSTCDGPPLPAPGLFLSSSGAITGTPTTARDFTQTYRVQDKNKAAVTKSLTLNIEPPPVIVSQGSGVLRGTFLFNLDNGTEAGCGADCDIWWEQMTDVARQMTPRNNARIVNLGVVDFNSITAERLKTLPYGPTPIPGNNDATNQLVTGDVFAVLTNQGNYAKVLVINYGYNLNIQWVTYAAQQVVLTSGENR